MKNNSAEVLRQLVGTRKLIVYLGEGGLNDNLNWSLLYLEKLGFARELVDGCCLYDNTPLHKSCGIRILDKTNLNKDAHFVIINSSQHQDKIAMDLSNIGFAENTDFIKSLNNDIDIRNLAIYETISNHINLSDKRVLDLCCGTGDLVKYIAQQPNPPTYIYGVDLKVTKKEIGDNYEIFNCNVHELPFENNSLDCVYSYSTFEHIYDIEKTLSEVKRVLKPHGRFFTKFGFVWTSVTGHHFWRKGDVNWNREYFSFIPPWGHLYMNELLMREHLEKQTGDSELINEICHWIYHGDRINRRSRQYHIKCLMNCGMLIRHYSETCCVNRFSMWGERTSELTDDIISKAVAAGYEEADLRVNGMTILLEKYSAI